MSLCIAAGGNILALAATAFSLTWTHSVEKTIWAEHWRIDNNALQLVQASVEGAGAGIDLPENAVRVEGAWVFRPALPPLPSLQLAASGATVSAWRLCTGERCLELGAEPGDPITLWAADRCASGKPNS